MTESSKKFIAMSRWVVIIIFSLRCLIGWGDLSAAIYEKEVFECGYSLFGYAGEAIGLTALFMATFNRWWKWKPLNVLAGGMPILGKKYKGKIRFVKDNKKQECDSEISIEQTFLNIIVRFDTAESMSNSVTAAIETINNEKLLVY